MSASTPSWTIASAMTVGIVRLVHSTREGAVGVMRPYRPSIPRIGKGFCNSAVKAPEGS